MKKKTHNAIAHMALNTHTLLATGMNKICESPASEMRANRV